MKYSYRAFGRRTGSCSRLWMSALRTRASVVKLPCWKVPSGLLSFYLALFGSFKHYLVIITGGLKHQKLMSTNNTQGIDILTHWSGRKEEIISGAVSDVFFGVGPKEAGPFLNGKKGFCFRKKLFFQCQGGPLLQLKALGETEIRGVPHGSHGSVQVKLGDGQPCFPCDVLRSTVAPRGPKRDVHRQNLNCVKCTLWWWKTRFGVLGIPGATFVFMIPGWEFGCLISRVWHELPMQAGCHSPRKQQGA